MEQVPVATAVAHVIWNVRTRRVWMYWMVSVTCPNITITTLTLEDEDGEVINQVAFYDAQEARRYLEYEAKWFQAQPGCQWVWLPAGEGR